LRASARSVVAERYGVATNFDAKIAVASLMESRRRLRRDCIDVLFLHECRSSDLADESLLEVLSEAKRRGDIRAFGIATDVETIEHASRSGSPFSDVVQMANSMSNRNLDRIAPYAGSRACLTHSTFGGVESREREHVVQALRYAVDANPQGVVVFSSQNPKHIAENASAFEKTAVM
jgi:aryl-alcohol dehydrogenase-like predicted oxidoreductase